MNKSVITGLIALLFALAACGGETKMVEVTQVVAERETVVMTVVETVVEKETVVETVIMGPTPMPLPTRAPSAAFAPTATPFSPSFVVEGDTTGAGASDTAELIATPVGQPVVEPLTAGEIDDNELFEKYLDYIRAYYGPLVHPVDVSERHIISVRDAQGLPVLDAHVTAFAEGELVFEGRTTATGQVLIHPRALGLQDGSAVAVRVEKDGVVNEIGFIGGQSDHHVVRLEHGGRVGAPVALDVLFLIDATGSMGDEIDKLKASILEISAQIDALPARPDVRFGMVTYRDRGDAYITQVYEFTPDVQAFQADLREVQAGSGGDTPESLNEGLHRAIWDAQWRSGETVRLVFLVADAPPHLDYDQDYDYAQEMVEAVRRGIKIIPIASSGLDDQGEYIFRQLAQSTLGRFVFLTYAEAGQPGSGPGAETDHSIAPQDYTVDVLDSLIVRLVTEELAALSDPAIRYGE